jgi:DNA-binding NtrC family response regulator
MHFVLFVDDEQRTRRYFAKLFGKTFRIILAEDGLAGLERFRQYQDQVGVVVSDERMPLECGYVFLKKVAVLKPAAVLLLSTAYCDSEDDADFIYRRIMEPWDVPDLEVTLRRAMELYMNRLERDELLLQQDQDLDEGGSKESLGD